MPIGLAQAMQQGLQGFVAGKRDKAAEDRQARLDKWAQEDRDYMVNTQRPAEERALKTQQETADIGLASIKEQKAYKDQQAELISQMQGAGYSRHKIAEAMRNNAMANNDIAGEKAWGDRYYTEMQNMVDGAQSLGDIQSIYNDIQDGFTANDFRVGEDGSITAYMQPNGKGEATAVPFKDAADLKAFVMHAAQNPEQGRALAAEIAKETRKNNAALNEIQAKGDQDRQTESAKNEGAIGLAAVKGRQDRLTEAEKGRQARLTKGTPAAPTTVNYNSGTGLGGSYKTIRGKNGSAAQQSTDASTDDEIERARDTIGFVTRQIEQGVPELDAWTKAGYKKDDRSALYALAKMRKSGDDDSWDKMNGKPASSERSAAFESRVKGTVDAITKFSQMPPAEQKKRFGAMVANTPPEIVAEAKRRLEGANRGPQFDRKAPVTKPQKGALADIGQPIATTIIR